MNNYVAIEVIFCRNGQSFGSNTHYVETIEDNISQILEKFVVQFYNVQNIPKEIIAKILEKTLENALFKNKY